MITISEIIDSVEALSTLAMEKAAERQMQLAKPPKSLGVLESLSIQLAGITGKINNTITRKDLLVFASDNGVVKENVASAPQSVTLMQTINLTRAKTGASVIAKHFGCNVSVCDVGVNSEIKASSVINRKIAFGTKNIAEAPAMSREQAKKAIEIGIEMVQMLKEKGTSVIGIGEMGIGNTTTSSAILSVLCDLQPEAITGRGGGITDEFLDNKIRVIKKALEVNKPDKNDVIDILSKVGGFDIAAMCGAFIGAAHMKIPVVIDGFISAVAALCAYKLCPNSLGYMFASHCSTEPGYLAAMKELKKEPLFMLKMRLGEGSGCPIAFEILSAACSVINDMATFEEANINDDYLDTIRKSESFMGEREN